MTRVLCKNFVNHFKTTSYKYIIFWGFCLTLEAGLSVSAVLQIVCAWSVRLTHVGAGVAVQTGLGWGDLRWEPLPEAAVGRYA